MVVVPGGCGAGAAAKARLCSQGLRWGQDWGDPGRSLTSPRQPPCSRGQDGTRGRPISIFNLDEARGLEQSQISILSRAEGLGATTSTMDCLWLASVPAQGTYPLSFRGNKVPLNITVQVYMEGSVQDKDRSWCSSQVDGVTSPENRSRRKSQVNTPQQLRCVWIQGRVFLIPI